jgi:hypothetical protein
LEVFRKRPGQSPAHHRQQGFISLISALQNLRTIGLLLNIAETGRAQIAHRDDSRAVTLPANYDV